MEFVKIFASEIKNKNNKLKQIMSLTITRNNKIYEVEGSLNSSTASYFKTHLAITLNSLKGLAIDINKVTEIDESGMQALKSIFDKSIAWNKPFYIIGNGSKKIYKELDYLNVA